MKIDYYFYSLIIISVFLFLLFFYWRKNRKIENIVQEYIRKTSTVTKARVLSHFSKEVDEISLLISKILILLNKYNLNNSDISEELPLNSAYHIMSKGNNSLMAVLELSLSGYFWEPPIILRTAMEGFATAWDIVHNPKRFDNWRTNKNFQSTKSITNYKEIDEKIGFLYGLLSQYYTHIGPKNSNQAIYMIGNTPIAQNFGFIPPGKEDIRKTEIYMLILVAYISLQTTEICFHEYANTYETVSKIPGELLMKAKVSERHKIFADKALSHFQQLSNNPLEKL